LSVRKKEQKLWDAMRKAKPPRAWLQRVENSVGVGMADVYFVESGVTAWVELKSVDMPVRSTTRFMGDEGLRVPEQVNWHLKAASTGLQTYVLVRERTRHELLFLLDGVHADVMNDWPLNSVAEHSLASDWAGIYKELAGGSLM